ncbi:hypothetical protein AMS68_001310 [Peltaster fructicola]|uniref:Peptidase M20 domain-containing protein 2 n=1 Tax=Peltaster fructicola TaxID=286661 RepID=A0A6H0XM49_9PEZI|nr:hypothetical protein AMS68_001310 [Peltaster fructicola]
MDTSMLSRIGRHIESISDDLRAISLDIHAHPELKFKERHAHHLLTTYLRQQSGWQVTSPAYGMDTAFVASFEGRSSGATVSFNAEYDALPGIGHACGHNLIAVVSLAAALAAAKIVHDDGLPGRVMIFGTPGEEGGGGKIKLLKAGAYQDVDVSMISHPGVTPDAALVHTAAYAEIHVEYFGKAAHAAAAPWEGVNALDALILTINNISASRQQNQPGDIIQYKITNGGEKPNIIHAYASGQFVLRAPSLERLSRLMDKFLACVEGAAMATAAKYRTVEGLGYLDHVSNQALGIRYGQHFGALGGHIDGPAITQASTDQGDISHAMPSISPFFWIRSETEDGAQLGGPHTPDFEKAARTTEAHELALRVAKALAATAVDVLSSSDLLKEVKREFQDMKRIGITARP